MSENTRTCYHLTLIKLTVGISRITLTSRFWIGTNHCVVLIGINPSSIIAKWSTQRGVIIELQVPTGWSGSIVGIGNRIVFSHLYILIGHKYSICICRIGVLKINNSARHSGGLSSPTRQYRICAFIERMGCSKWNSINSIRSTSASSHPIGQNRICYLLYRSSCKGIYIIILMRIQRRRYPMKFIKNSISRNETTA